MSTDDQTPLPRHRKHGRARRRGASLQGRHLRRVGDAPACACPAGYHEYGVHAPGHRPTSEIPLGRPGAYPIEDLAAMSTGALDLLLGRADAAAAYDQVKVSHLVIIRESATGELRYEGPFATGSEALRAGARFVEQNRALDPSRMFTLTVAPLP